MAARTGARHTLPPFHHPLHLVASYQALGEGETVLPASGTNIQQLLAAQAAADASATASASSGPYVSSTKTCCSDSVSDMSIAAAVAVASPATPAKQQPASTNPAAAASPATGATTASAAAAAAQTQAFPVDASVAQHQIALRHYTFASEQGNVDALRVIGA